MTWRKSTRCGANGACVEVAALKRHVGVRDSKDPAGAVLVVSRDEFGTLLDQVKQDSFLSLELN